MTSPRPPQVGHGRPFCSPDPLQSGQVSGAALGTSAGASSPGAMSLVRSSLMVGGCPAVAPRNRPGVRSRVRPGYGDGMDEQQKQAFEEALERKNAEAERKAIANQPHPPAGMEDEAGISEEAPLIEDGRTQDVRDVRAKNSGKGKKTADKWNQ